jgi:4-hydroxybenzoate polyprenyltransferase
MSDSLVTAEPVLVSRNRSSVKDLLISLRPYQWTKNLVIFAPLIFAKELTNPQLLLLSVLAFFNFCFLSSGVYLINDVLDYEKDRHHPEKKNRPVAAGKVSVPTAISMGIFLYVASLVAAYFLGKEFLQVAILYTFVSLGYNFYFKKIAILDVMAISIGFVLRAIAGSVVIHVESSFWLLLCTFLLALFLALSKRRHELVFLSESAVKHRTNLAEYSPYLLDQMIGVVTASCVLAYTLYTVSDETVAKFHTNRLSLTIPFVYFGIFRYLYLIHQKNEGGKPSRHLYSDRPLLVSIILWIVACVVIIYSSSLPGMF